MDHHNIVVKVTACIGFISVNVFDIECQFLV